MEDTLESELAAYRAQPTPEGRRKFLERCYPLLQKVAGAILRSLPRATGVELDDLVSDGVFGVCAAIDGFDAGQGCRFSTYATLRIRGAILDAIRQRDWVPRLERQQAAAGLVNPKTMFNVDWTERAYGDGQWSPGTHLEPTASPEPVRNDDFWTELLRGMNQRERLIVLLYWREELTMKEVGEQFGLSESRVSQVHSHLLERMRDTLAAPRRKPAAAAVWRPLPRAAPAIVLDGPLYDYVAPRPSPRKVPRMNVSTMVEQLATLPIEDIDQEITETQRRLDLLQRMRAIVGGKPAPRAGGRKKAAAEPLPITEIDETLPFDDESIERTVRVRRFLKVHGPSKTVRIAEACGIPLGSITSVLTRTPGVTKTDAGLCELSGE